MAVQRVIMPKLGAYTEDVLLSEWLVGEGEQVAPGGAVLELETEKTTAEVEAESSGWLHQLVPAGQAVPIGATVALIAETREEYEALAAPDAGEEQRPEADEEGTGNPFLGYIAHGGGTAVSQLAGTPTGAAGLREPAPPASAGALLISPRARALLKELGFAPEHAREIPGSGPGNRIVDRDVAAWAAAREQLPPPSAPAAAGALTVSSTIPLRGRRGTIASRMVTSLQQSAQLTSVLEIDVKPLVEFRARLNAEGAVPRIGVTAIVVKLVAGALRRHPRLNARVSESAIEELAEINVAVAVETDGGLVAPVVAGADRLSREQRYARILEPRDPCARRRARPRRARRRHLHRLQRRHPPRRHHNGDPQPAAVRDPLDRADPRAAGGGGRGSDRGPPDAAGLPHLRPSRGRRGAGRRLPGDLRVARLRAPAAPLLMDAQQQDATAIAPPTMLALFRTMLTIRLFERRVAREFRTGQIPGFVHMYVGEEAVAAGVCANLDERDYVTSTHRGHGHCIAKGCELRLMMAEIYGREDGLCKGRGGSMHIADFSRGMLGANAIVGGGIALATGAGLASSVRGSGEVAVAFFGDGAVNQGVLHESLNLAAIWKLPVVYVCENNGFAESTPAAYSTSVPDVAIRATGYGIPGVIADGADALEVYRAARTAVQRARAGEGPTLLEVKTHRFMGHFEGDPEKYRDDADRRQTGERDALEALRSLLLAGAHASEHELDALTAEIESSVDEAVEFAKASPFPDPAEIERYVYPEPLARAEPS